jgi:hypothetical protein
MDGKIVVKQGSVDNQQNLKEEKYWDGLIDGLLHGRTTRDPAFLARASQFV